MVGWRRSQSYERTFWALGLTGQGLRSGTVHGEFEEQSGDYCGQSRVRKPARQGAGDVADGAGAGKMMEGLNGERL